ncbi:cytokine-induced anti-apoptosis inhibitor 1, Fe-S biogenesis-domain-containing protein [Zychaea mexicana]|uniref:cytokine-induced anti-apoptosis inhibitor 1, Fe-S biogenesis-domain-containing protein n=1 Tax=Zychaea mexicana TaxID=64656 RepID=UPI0022FDF15B|nr:cytokine-induced anti-apoptosis inhibitor 1, Fe-S biogenesis-domain-containing protein [Zychaea mexicana]KAI9499612.1 cytokine-induced anti-apoptosis inhibitor 1, Fe-S biogenesis-domain-containing protein [Zychaea mexicana]
MVVANFEASQGESVLFVSPATVNQDALAKAKASAQDQVGANGTTAFEAMERVAEAPLAKASYNKIYSNAIPPTNSVHTPQVLSRFLSTLTASGSLVLIEPVLLTELSNSMCPVTRKEADLVSLLKLTGFVDVNVTRVEPVSDADLAEFIQAWGAVRVEQGVEALSGKLALAHVEVKKPAYEVGQKMTLNFRKKKPATTPAETKKSVWKISGNDDDEDELEDADALLDDDDLVKPSKESLVRPDDCEMTDGRRKACKNCTCGRAEMDETDESDNVVSLDLMEDDGDTSDDVVDVDPTPKAVGGCGSCALGDAFRCSTCPFLGMPAFNPGEKVTLGGMFEKDDIDI